MLQSLCDTDARLHTLLAPNIGGLATAVVTKKQSKCQHLTLIVIFKLVKTIQLISSPLRDVAD